VSAEHHIVSPKVYFTIFGLLMLCTFLTVKAAEFDLNQYFSGLNIIVALVIATFKASLVVLFFMHGKYSPKRTQLVIICSVFWLAVMLFMTMSDYISRSWL
jgi:cytochrome c oxidase subunit IV